MHRTLTRICILATLVGSACAAVGGGISGGGMGGGGGGGGGMGGGGGGMSGGMGGGGGMAGPMNGPVEGAGGVVGPGAAGNWGGGGNNAGNPVVGQRYTVVFTADGSGTKALSALSFGMHDLTCSFLARNWSIDKLGYEGEDKTFTATLTDAHGNSLKLSGTIAKSAITGTLALHRAADDRTIGYAFHGGIAGSAEADAAKAEVEPHGAKAR